MTTLSNNDLLMEARRVFLSSYAQQIEHMLPRAISQLFALADKAPSGRDQRNLLDAYTALTKSSESLQQHTTAALELLLNRSFQTAYDTFRPSFSSNRNLSALSLVDASAIDDELRIDSMTKRFRDAAEESLRDLNIRMALLLDQLIIKERENPFRPYLFSRSLVDAVETLNLPEELAQVLLNQLCTTFAEHVVELYGQVNQLLAEHGVAAQLQLKVQPACASSSDIGEQADQDAAIAPDQSPPPSNPALAGASASSSPNQADPSRVNQLFSALGRSPREQTAPPPPSAPAASPANNLGSWFMGEQGLGGSLRRLFSPPAGAALLLPTQAAEPSPLLSALSGLVRDNTPATAAMLDGQGEVRNLVQELRPGLSGMAQDSHEQMVIDVVALLFEIILKDTQIPAEIRAQLGRLQLLVLKVALRDPGLFSQSHHPARMLVNRIGSISQGLEKVGSLSETVISEIRKIIETLLADEQDPISAFNRMLDEFDGFIAAQFRASNEALARAVSAVQQAEQRTLHFARISGAISDAIKDLTLDPNLRDFLLGPWASVIERARADAPEQLASYQALIPLLLWSVAPKLNADDRKHLLKTIPHLLAQLRAGLSLINFPQEQSEIWFDWLMESHTLVSRSLASSQNIPSLLDMQQSIGEPLRQRLESHLESADLTTALTLNRQMLDEAMREQDADLEYLEAPQAPAAAAAANLESEPAAEALARLHSGVWLELNLEGHPCQANLSWINQDSSHLLLCREDAPPMLIGSRLLLRLIKQGRARFIEDAPLFERAMQTLLNSADKIDQPKVA